MRLLLLFREIVTRPALGESWWIIIKLLTTNQTSLAGGRVARNAEVLGGATESQGQWEVQRRHLISRSTSDEVTLTLQNSESNVYFSRSITAVPTSIATKWCWQWGVKNSVCRRGGGWAQMHVPLRGQPHREASDRNSSRWWLSSKSRPPCLCNLPHSSCLIVTKMHANI